MKQGMKIVVLCGGLSPERNVSISSGTKIATALKSKGHQVVLLDMYYGLEDWEGNTSEIFDNPPPIGTNFTVGAAPDLEQIKAARKLKSDNQFGDRVLEVCQMADIVFMASHGQCGEDGRVQAAFDLFGIKYTGAGFLSSAIAMDKDYTKQIAVQCGVKTPLWRSFECAEVTADEVLGVMDLPLVIKPDNSGSSIGVSIASTREELEKALKDAAHESSRVVIEQFVKGREIQIGILAGEALPSIEIIPKTGFYDYKNKYEAGASEEVTPAPIPEEAEIRIRQIAMKVFNMLHLEVYSRADFIYDDQGEFWFLEINTLPGMTPTSLVPQEAAVIGYSYEDLCEKIIEESMRKYSK